MRELVYTGPEKVEWQEAPAPKLQGDGEAIVRPLAVASCDLDQAIVRGLTAFPPPFALGHESVGEVVEVGDAVTGVRPGDVVVVPFQPACGTCDFCRRGHPASCTVVPRTSMYGIGAAGGGFGGALSDAIRVPFADAMLLPLPEGVSPAAAASAGDNVADGWRGVAPPLAERPGAPVLVLGGGIAGSIPLYAAMIAVALGSERVDYYDRDRRRLEIAARVGARPHEIGDWPKRLGSWPIVVEGCVQPEGLACAIRSTEPGGHLTATSIFFGPVEIPITEMYMKGITLRTGRVHSRAVLPDVLELLRTGTIDPRTVTSETAGWNEAPEAILSYTTKLVVSR